MISEKVIWFVTRWVVRHPKLAYSLVYPVKMVLQAWYKHIARSLSLAELEYAKESYATELQNFLSSFLDSTPDDELEQFSELKNTFTKTDAYLLSMGMGLTEEEMERIINNELFLAKHRRKQAKSKETVGVRL